jgi:subtilisin family serine protease
MYNYKSSFLALCFLLIALTASAQQKYWISFQSKDIENYNYEENLSSQAIQKRINLNIPLFQYTDVPVSQLFKDSLRSLGIETKVTSKWLNAISANLTQNQVDQLKTLDFVQSVDKITVSFQVAAVQTELNPKNYSITLEQMKASAFVEEGLSGKNVKIGVIDAGFYTADRDPRLIHLFDENKVKAQKDFVNPERTDLVETFVTNSDTHGKSVLEYLAGYYISERFQTGLAVNADFYLARTENGDVEHRLEEDHWILAMEWMDSLGVRLINTSLGYANHMDDPLENYKQEEMNGSTTRISKAAHIAVEEKGIFLVVSAGNEGGNPNWRIISAPADVQGVLSVGATNADNLTRNWYSSIGPDFNPYLKPNVSVYSPNGTSFSAPAITGFMACLMEKDSTLDNRALMEIVEKSGHLYPYGNNYIGYGVPQADIALKIMADSSITIERNELVTEKDRVELVFKKNAKKGKIAVFHKSNLTRVVQQEVLALKKRKLILLRKPGVSFSTVQFDDQVIEVIWKE